MQVWDDSIIETAEDEFYESDVEEFVDALKKNITVCYLRLKKIACCCDISYAPSMAIRSSSSRLKIFLTTSESITISNAPI